MAFLVEAAPRFRDGGLELLAVFESPAERMIKTFRDREIPFPVIADPSRKLYRLYGVTSSLLGHIRGAFRVKAFRDALGRGFRFGRIDGVATQLPAEFLIGADGIIERAYYGRDIGDHLPIHEIDRWLRNRS